MNAAKARELGVFIRNYQTFLHAVAEHREDIALLRRSPRLFEDVTMTSPAGVKLMAKLDPELENVHLAGMKDRFLDMGVTDRQFHQMVKAARADFGGPPEKKR